MSISLCIATYKRAERLALVLGDIAAQSLRPVEVAVVDNDAAASARATVERLVASGLPFPVHYEVQPARGIALTRNRTVALAAAGEWVAFIDDDERAPPDWLAKLIAAVERHAADAVLAPVIPVVPEYAPGWLRRGSFYDFPRMATGAVVPLNRLRFGNVMIRGAPLRAEPGPFDPNYGLTTGEDADLLARLAGKGLKIIWCDEAIVTEPVEPARLRFRWLMLRAYSGGQEFARKTLRGVYGRPNQLGILRLYAQSAAQLGVAGLLALLVLPFGRHRCVYWLIRAAANYGKLSILWGSHYDEYAQVPG